MTDSHYQSSASNADDCVSKIIEASSLEKSGQIEKAIALYQEILELDKGGSYGAVAEKALANLQVSNTSSSKTTTKVKSDASWWTKLSLRWKVMSVAVALTSLPIIGLGTTVYLVVADSIETQTAEIEQARAFELADKTNRFMFERYRDIQIIAEGDIFANSQTKESDISANKEATLDKYIASYLFYDSIVHFDLQGNVVARSKDIEVTNHKNQKYFQEVIKTGKPVFSEPKIFEDNEEKVIYLAAPIIERSNRRITGVVSARMPLKYIEEEVANFHVGGEEYHLVDGYGNFFIAFKEEQIGDKLSEHYPELAPIIANGEVGALISTDKIENREQLVAYSPFQPLGTMPPLTWEAVISVDTEIAFALEKKLLLTLEIGIAVTVLAVAALAVYLSDKGTAPLLKSQETLQQIGRGNLDVRMEVKGTDELAQLGSNINLMADRIQGLVKQQEAEALKQRQEKEKLQAGVMNLLMDVEGAQKGDLTIQAQMSDGAVGSIADAFNATIRKLRKLLEQVQTVTVEVGELSKTGENSVRQLSSAALNQAEGIDAALVNIAEINESVNNVAKFAQEAAKIATEGLLQAQEGDTAMDMTVESIEKIRLTVAGTSKKAKQLGESSQEIAQIVDIISGISEKTNLLAFNASVEAARAGEHGEGFRIVAEEVRRLADRITESTKDIKQLVSTIQQNTTSLLQEMETSTTEVVTGSQLVRKTKQTLQRLANTSQTIDRYLQSISTSTIEQTNTSRQVNEKIAGIANIAKNNSTEAQDVVKSLHTLVEEAENLQSSVSQFKLKA